MKTIFIVMISLLLMNCASVPLKAPCDQHAHWCGTKTKINLW